MRQFGAFFMATTIALTSLPVHAGYRLDFEKVVRTAVETDVPIDSRDLQEYLKLDHRSFYNEVMKFYRSSRANAVFLERFREWKNNSPNSWQVSHEKIEAFFAQTFFLFTLFKRKRDPLIEHGYEGWRAAFLDVNYRLMSSPEAAEGWSKELRGFFALAFLEAGPWTPEEIFTIEKFLKSKSDLDGKGWYSKFRKRLRRHFNRGEHLDDEISNQAELVGLFGGILIGAPVAAGVAWEYWNLLYAVGDAVKYSHPDGLTGFFAFALWTAIGFGVTSVAWERTASALKTTPLFQLHQYRRTSDMLRLGPISCEEMISER